MRIKAIVRYVDRILPQPALTPLNPQLAARMDQLMNVNDWYLFQGVANFIGNQQVVGPRLICSYRRRDAKSSGGVR